MTNSTLQATPVNECSVTPIVREIRLNIEKANNGYIVYDYSGDAYPSPRWVYSDLTEAKNKAVSLILGADL